jgi:hypothetical protein
MEGFMTPRAAVLMPVVLATLAACDSPTEFNADRDVDITVGDAVADVHETEVTVPLTVTIQNASREMIQHGHGCGIAVLRGAADVSISIWGGCWFPGPSPEAMRIAPGEHLTVMLAATAPREEWGEVISGEYVLDLGLWLPVEDEPHALRLEPVSSRPFQIEVAGGSGRAGTP